MASGGGRLCEPNASRTPQGVAGFAAYEAPLKGARAFGLCHLGAREPQTLLTQCLLSRCSKWRVPRADPAPLRPTSSPTRPANGCKACAMRR